MYIDSPQPLSREGSSGEPITSKKGAGKQIILPLATLLMALGVFEVIGLIIFVSITNVDITHSIWPVMLLGIPTVGIIIVLSIISLLSRNSKKLQKAYIKTKIEECRHLANFYLSREKEFSGLVLQESEKIFQKINDAFENTLGNLDKGHSDAEKLLQDLIQKIRTEEQNELKQARDEQERKSIKKSYQECIDFTLFFTRKEWQKIIREAKDQVSNNSTTSIELQIDARDSLIQDYKSSVEKKAQQSELEALQWEKFLQENYV